LGVKLWPSGRTLSGRNLTRVNERLGPGNILSYSGLMRAHGKTKQVKHFNWLVCGEILDVFN
jgi:hypothetical protein